MQLIKLYNYDVYFPIAMVYLGIVDWYHTVVTSESIFQLYISTSYYRRLPNVNYYRLTWTLFVVALVAKR